MYSFGSTKFQVSEEKYSNELTIRIAEEKCPAKGAYKNTRRDDDTIIKNNKSNGKLRKALWSILIAIVEKYIYDNFILCFCLCNQCLSSLTL
jgi:hypothetical protein